MHSNMDRKMEFLFNMYFGMEEQKLKRFIIRAYLDMSRTLHGITEHDPNGIIKAAASESLENCFKHLQEMTVPNNNTVLLEEFDKWHHGSAIDLITHYNDALGVNKPFHLYYGQAQKWINMTMKYCWLCDEAELKHLTPWFPSAHIPVDEIILKAVEGEGICKRPCERWARWDDYKQYQVFQDLIRCEVKNRCPSTLEMEYYLWNRYRDQLKA